MWQSPCYHPPVQSSADQSLQCDKDNQQNKTRLDLKGFAGSRTAGMENKTLYLHFFASNLCSLKVLDPSFGSKNQILQL